MNGWLLDTNVVSELRKTRPAPRVKAWSDAQPPDSLFLSTVTLAEIRYGIECQSDPAFRQELESWLDGGLRPWFAQRILPVDEDVILEWRRMVARGRRAVDHLQSAGPVHRRDREAACADRLHAQRERLPRRGGPRPQSLVGVIAGSRRPAV